MEITLALEIAAEPMFRNVMDGRDYRSLLRKVKLPESPLPVEVVVATELRRRSIRQRVTYVPLLAL